MALHLSPHMVVMQNAAQKASKRLLRDFNEVEQLQVSVKGPSDFVSQADLRAEKILREELEKARPGYAFLMEESGASGSANWTWRWVVDPLDGTTNFLHGIPHWAISIALQRKLADGSVELAAGVVYSPTPDEMFWAEKGGGAFLNDRRLRVSARRELKDALFATGIPFAAVSPRNRLAFARTLGALMPATAGVRRFGSAALDLAWVAAGRYDGYWELGLNAWDIAAGALIVREAGGTVTHPDGSEFVVADAAANDLVAGNAHLHGKLRELVADGVAAGSGKEGQGRALAFLTFSSLCFAAMRYISTRGQAPERDFAGVLLAGLAEDGGLYVPAAWPHFSAADLRSMRCLPYAEAAARVIAPFVGDCVPFEALRGMCREAYAGFTHPAVAPLVQLDTDLWVLELFHGPTLAFKDFALQLLGRLFDHVLTERDERITVLGATSGDTGSAAIEACRGRARVDIAILHPHGRTSEVQRRQMTTVAAPNVLNLAVEGNFDDCQDLVKAAFADAPFRQEVRLAAVNSINWARIAAQIAYYVVAALAVGAPEREVAFAVPTGNFGNVLAAWAARRMGLPVVRLTVASNRNDILARFLASNDMSIHPVEASLSPSMDIAVSSNFERLLFELLGRDATQTAATMADFRATGRMAVPENAWRKARELFHGFALNDPNTLAEIRATHAATGYLADPHTATAIAAARASRPPHLPTIVAATAHPAKFPDAIEQAIGIRPPLPPHLADLYERPEHFSVVPADLATIEARLRAFTARNTA